MYLKLSPLYIKTDFRNLIKDTLARHQNILILNHEEWKQGT